MASKADSARPSDKSTFGGFTFTAKPVVTEKKEEAKVDEQKKETKETEKEEAKVNPFASFSFGASKPAAKPAETKAPEGNL